jgi:hypothetical protein
MSIDLSFSLYLAISNADIMNYFIFFVSYYTKLRSNYLPYKSEFQI